MIRIIWTKELGSNTVSLKGTNGSLIVAAGFLFWASH